MLELEQIEKATVGELKIMLKLFQHDIRHAESWLQELKRTETNLKIVLRQKTDPHDKNRETALKRQLLKCGLKQKTLAKRLGISRAAVSLQVRTGIRMVKVAAKYAEALNCDPRSLLDF
ncbi:MAG: helix-turn-helix transcriptional regulator [Victivallales bacterium]|nr:helix-turn-helix transcriptional regulator [Victivallales bacterium]